MDVNIICPDDGETTVPVQINIDNIKIQRPEGHNSKIQLDDDILMELKYPSLEEFIKNNFDLEDQNQLEQSFDLIASCIESVYTADDVWTTADCTKKEIIEFLEQMNSRQFKEIEKFFTTMPKLSHEVKVTNPKTKVKSTVILEGLSSFFA